MMMLQTKNCSTDLSLYLDLASPRPHQYSMYP